MSDKEQKAKEKKQQALSLDLQSKDEKKIKAALERTEELGDASHIRPLMMAFRDLEEGQLKEELRNTLSTIKLSDAESIYMDALEEEEFRPIYGDILAFTWNAGFQPVDAVDLITRTALEGDYMTAVEGYTLLDSMNGPLDEESLLQGLVVVREFMLKHKEDGHPNYELAISIFEILSRHEREE